MLEAFKDRNGIILLIVATLAAGLMFWPVPYSELDYTSTSHLTTWIISALIAGFIGVILLRKSTKHSTIVVTTGFLLAVIIKVNIDYFDDPSNHNLVPFELLITLLIALPPAFIGAWVGNMLIRK